jgi:hypothetical protein
MNAEQSVPKHDQLDKDEMRDSRLLIELQKEEVIHEPRWRLRTE